jgi:glycosyltransferase involved in cell wall biosynthesis
VSVLIPTFNSESTIEETLDSVKNQTYKNLEVHIVDDGSNDRTLEIVEKNLDDRTTSSIQENAGAAAARNKAFENSCGRYVFFLDSDDIICPTHIEALLGMIEGCDDAIAFGQWDRFNKCSNEAQFPERPTNRSMDGPSWLLLNWQKIDMMQCGTFLLPRNLVEIHGGWNPAFSQNEDFEFFARIFSNCNGMHYAPDARLYYRSVFRQSVSQRRDRQAIESTFRAFDLGTSHLLRVRDTPEARAACADIFQRFIYDQYPFNVVLRRRAADRVRRYGGASAVPKGPPGFHKLRPLLGWKIARLVQIMVTRFGFNAAGRPNALVSRLSSTMIRRAIGRIMP